jgi:hypothetical protein
MARTKGAVSFCEVSLADLNAILRPDAKILVARRYAAMHNIPSTPMRATSENIAASGNPVSVKEEGVEVTEH